MSLSIAAIAGIAAGGAALLVLVAVVIALWCRARARRNRTSETGSSDPSTLGELRLLFRVPSMDGNAAAAAFFLRQIFSSALLMQCLCVAGGISGVGQGGPKFLGAGASGRETVLSRGAGAGDQQLQRGQLGWRRELWPGVQGVAF